MEFRIKKIILVKDIIAYQICIVGRCGVCHRKDEEVIETLTYKEEAEQYLEKLNHAKIK